jgi:hypothetical protein
MIEHWIDALQDVWGTIQGRGFTTMNAPRPIKDGRYPASIDPNLLERSPIAFTFPEQVQFKYSAGGPNEAFYQGSTEFHVAANLDLSTVPQLLHWPGLIVAKIAANMKLGGLVQHIVLQDRSDQIQGPLSLQFGNEAAHWGFIAYWEVKEIVNSSVTVATGE